MSLPNSSEIHKSVLLNESIALLEISPGDIVIDGTFGGGGSSKAILESQENISLVCVDLDEEAFGRFSERFANEPRATFVHANFKDAKQILKQSGKDKVNKVFFDLGTSTFQLLLDTRGFSFNSDAPLVMTFSKEGSHTGFTARDIVNLWEESSIADIIFYYSDERRARKIAKAIVDARNKKPIETSKELASIIEGVSPRRGKTHPATKTFQALRIAVNDELKVIEEALTNWLELLSLNGRIAVITFHSLEDRIVKHWMIHRFKDKKDIRVITKKPIVPTKLELQINPRARSAKLRVIEKIL